MTEEEWRDRWSRLHAIHVEDVRRRKEVRNYRAANFSIEEIERALALKKRGKPDPPRQNWGAIVMSALALAKDLVATIQRVQKYIPEDVQKQNYIWPSNGNYYARYSRLMRKFKEMRQEQ